MEIYQVGGAVRDQLLGLPVSERDWVVVGATPAQMRAQGYQQPDPDFPVFIHPVSHEEYALARRETKIAPGYKGFSIDAAPNVTLEEDLQRRDLTINALAQAADGRIIDPYGGQRDLQWGVLRHVSPAFVQDPLRLLRLARFAAHLGRYGFRVAHSTQKLLPEMVAAGEWATLPPERLTRELLRALASDRPARFFAVLQSCGALPLLLPELAVVGAPVAGHGQDGPPPLWAALDQAARQQAALPVRWSLIGHVLGLAALASLHLRLALPAACRRAAEQLAACGTLAQTAQTPAEWMRLFDQLDAWRQPQRLNEVLEALQVLAPSAAARVQADAQAQRLRQAWQVVVALNGRTLQAQGIAPGPGLGQQLRAARLAALAAFSAA